MRNKLYYHECAYVWCSRNALALGTCAWQPSKQRTFCINEKVYGKRDPFVQTENGEPRIKIVSVVKGQLVDKTISGKATPN